MIGRLAICVSCGATAIACHLWGNKIKGRVEHFNNITRVINLRWLDDFLKENTTKLHVLVSGKVASPTAFKCKDNGPLRVVLEDTMELGLENKLEDGGLINKSFNFLLQHKRAPWYLEDSTGRVKVVGADEAEGIIQFVKVYANAPFFKTLLSDKEGSTVIYGHAIKVGTSLTFVGEAVRDNAGNLMIQKPKEQSLMVFSEESSFDKMVENMKSNSEFYIFYSKIFGTIAVVIAVMYGVDFVRKVLLPSMRKKKNSGNNGSENDKSDN